MRRIKTHGPVVAATVLGLGAGAAIGLSHAGGGANRTVTATTTRTVAQLRTVEKLRTKAAHVPSPVRTASGGTPAARGRRAGGATAAPARPGRTRDFAGSGSASLGTITVRVAATLRWTNTAGHFRILFDGNGVGVDSTARSGLSFAPPQTYRNVEVNTPGRWTIQIG